MIQLILACVSFVGSHLLLSHHLRVPLVKTLGDARFLWFYSFIGAATFGWIVYAFRQMPAQAPLWVAGEAVWTLSSLIMLLAAMFFVGSLVRNPAMTTTSANLLTQIPIGVFKITRHAMNASFVLWAIAHVLVSPRPAVIVLAGAIATLAVVGSIGQDRKKLRLHGEPWRQWMEQTAFIPFSKGAAFPGMHAVGGGLVIWLVATWLHPHLGAGQLVGLWRWLGW